MEHRAFVPVMSPAAADLAQQRELHVAWRTSEEQNPARTFSVGSGYVHALVRAMQVS